MLIDGLTAQSAAVRSATILLVCVTSTACVGDTRAESQSGRLSSRMSVRNAHAMAYDSVFNRVTLFGGADATQVRGDTWQWISESREWRPVDVPGPSPRTFPAFVFDVGRREGILFGGNTVLFGTGDETDSFLGDTWRFKDGRWAPLAVTGPSPRAEAAVAYDSRRRRIVLFGGYHRAARRNVRLGDTWEWDGTGWTNVASIGPSPRNGSAMVFDERRGRVVLFGGSGPSAETWEWDGRSWTALAAGAVPGRFNPVMAFDVARSIIIRFGGWTGTARSDDTWTLRDGTWGALDAHGPSPRNHSSAAYDRRRKRMVLFGGHDGDNVFGDTWEWDGGQWHQMSTQPSQRRVDNKH